MTDRRTAPTRVGVVGAGAIATNIHVPTLMNLPDVRIAWIADAFVDRAKSLAEAIGAKAYRPELMSETDLLLLAIPVPGRAEWLLRAADASAAVMVEKPFANDQQQHREFMACLPADRLAAGYQRRYYATSRFARQAVRLGWFGRLRKIEHREGGRVSSGGPTNYEDAPTVEGGGVLKNLGCHGIDLAAYIVEAETATVVESRLEMDGLVDREFEATVTLHGKAGDCILDTRVSYLDDQSNTISFVFENATLSCPVQPSMRFCIDESATFDVPLAGAATSAQAAYLMWDDFVRALRTHIAPTNAAQTALLTTRIIDDIISMGGQAR